MHILYFHQHFSTPKGAAGIRSYQMARSLIEHGHQVTMVCGSYGIGDTGLTDPFRSGRREGTVDGIRVIEFNLAYSNKDSFAKRTLLFARYALGGIKLALSLPYDRLFATTTPLTAGLPGIAARWLRGKPFVFEVRDLWPELPRAMGVITNPVVLGLMSTLEWVSYKSAHRLVALSPGITKGITRSGIPRNQVALIPNGCDIDIFSQGDRQPWRPKGVNPTEMMAVFAGTHGAANGLDNLLDATSLLIARGRTDIKIVLVGDGRQKADLQERAAREGLENVIFHPPVDKARLAGLMMAADLGIQCLADVPAFYYGTSPNKFFDYLAAGLPVLNNYPGWVADLIVENDCGFVVPSGDASSLADALIQAADNRVALKRMGVNSAALAHARFDRQLLARDWVNWVAGAWT